jgi:hypothetical protein
MESEKSKVETWEETKKRFENQYSDYENLVTLVSSLQNWFEREWGHGSKTKSLTKFDRFFSEEGSRGVLTPDFVASFRTPYILWGECMKTFRPLGKGGEEDAKQILSYARFAPPPIGETSPGYDVVVFVGTHSDTAAQDALMNAKKEPGLAPIVVIGFYKDEEKVQGDWYNLKWRDLEGVNSRFTEPNVTDRRNEGLNKILVAATNYPIQVDMQCILIGEHRPFVNDPPPPFYTFVRVIYPAISQLLDQTETDRLMARGAVEKNFTQDDLQNVPLLHGKEYPKRYISEALQWMAEKGFLRRDPKSRPMLYTWKMDWRKKKDLKEWILEKASKKEDRFRARAARLKKNQRSEQFKDELPGLFSPSQDSGK